MVELQADTSFNSWKQSFREKVLQKGITATVFNRAFNKIKVDPDVVKLDSDQPEFTRSIWIYLDMATSASRLKLGKKLLRKHHFLLDTVEKRYGVEREVIVAIWAMESDFGRNYGNKSIIRSLATLAYDAKNNSNKERLEYAETELFMALRILQTQNIKVQDMLGSWAGAMGQPQFTPSSYMKYAVDYNGDGVKDLWQTYSDVFASIANYLASSGWRRDESWGVEVTLPKKFDWRLNTSSYQLRYEQWEELGIHRWDKIPYESPKRLVSLFVPAGKTGPIFLVEHNFETIKRYNNSTSYTLAVAQLSRLLVDGKKIQKLWPRKDAALSRYQIEEIQMRLNLEGHNPGKVDGKIGPKTREAIRTWQMEQGLPGDGYANLLLLNDLKSKKIK